jgi:predicted nucleotidyltransferase
VLFGSRARDDARHGSDYDIAVLLRDMPDRFAELDRLARIGTRVTDTTGEVVNARHTMRHHIAIAHRSCVKSAATASIFDAGKRALPDGRKDWPRDKHP